MQKHATWLVPLILIVPVHLCSAQHCRAVADSAAQQRFKPRGDTVIDQRRRLIWMRCSVGQHWDSDTNTCSGKAQMFTWDQANNFSNSPELGGDQWRLPSINELSAITELSCYDPAINLQLFPNTPASHYWTATPFVAKQGHYWLVQFLNGENHNDTGVRRAFARLVKHLSSPQEQHGG